MAQETVLVTGANGFIGLHVLHHCFKRHWNVIGTARSEKAASLLQSLFPEQTSSSQLKIAKIQGITQTEFYKPAFQGAGVTAVINTASPIVYNVSDVAKEILDPAISSATAILEAAASYGGESVRRVVHVSSGAAFIDPSQGKGPGKHYTTEDWNPTTYEQAVAGGAGLAYMASKALAERAMWKWKDEHPSTSFDLVSVAPAAVFGKQYLGALEGKQTVDLKNLNLSIKTIWAIASPEVAKTTDTSFHMGGWVYVSDLAEALCKAVTTPEAGGLRIPCTQRCHWQLIRDSARRVLPELRERIDPGTPGLAEKEKELSYAMDGSRMTSVLGVGYTSLDVALKEVYEQLLEAEKAQG
jgi:NADPH-dependent methylglyoxal reductase